MAPGVMLKKVFRFKFCLFLTIGLLSSTSHSSRKYSCSSDLRIVLSQPIIDESTAICLKNVPKEYLRHPNFDEFSYDPDQKRISKQSIREAMAAIHLMNTLQVPGPVARGRAGAFADFVDADGFGFDIKAKSSARSVSGRPFNADDFALEVEKKMSRPFINTVTGMPANIRVFVDLTWLNPSDRAAVQELLGDSVQYFELPEPQAHFRAVTE